LSCDGNCYLEKMKTKNKYFKLKLKSWPNPFLMVFLLNKSDIFLVNNNIPRILVITKFPYLIMTERDW
jgi:hypothetical protein